MKKRIFAAVLASAMVLSLAACGGGNGGGSSASDPAGGSDVSAVAPGGSGASDPDGSQPDGSLPDASDPGGSNPEGSNPDSSQPDSSNPDSSQPDGSAPGKVAVTLNKTDVTLKKAGSSFRLRYTATPDTDGVPSFTSDKPEIAAVDESGNVTAVAPGTATITVTYDGAQAACVIRCRWEEPSDSPDSGESSSGSGSSSGNDSTSGSDSGDSAARVDLSAFYTATTGKYEFGSLELADDAILDQLYSGLSGIGTEQKLVYITMMSMNSGEFGLVQVKDSKDVDAVKAIFQSRIDYMAGDDETIGGAFYPFACESWRNNSRVVSNGNYVMMIVHENCDDIVKDFNALF